MATQVPADSATEHTLVRHPVDRISVRIRVGTGLLAATDDPMFLRLIGPCGREFRLLQESGKSLRRGREDTFVLGPPGSPETSVSHPELNDPTNPPLYREEIDRVVLIKRTDPVPNVRGIGEMDDRVLIEEAEVLIHSEGIPAARFRREGPHWLGLVCGLTLELAPVDAGEHVESSQG